MSLIISPYSFSSAAATDPYFANVVSLLHADGANGGTTFTDVIGKSWSRNGTNTITATSEKKYGSASVYVGNSVGPSTNNGIKTASSTDFDYGTADFTIEWWHYFTSLTDYQVTYDRGGTAGLLILTDTGNGRFITYVGGAAVMTEPSGATTSTWQHHALVKDSGTLRKYRGGVQTVSVSNSTSISSSAQAAWGAYANGTNATSGFLDDMRITKGVCRYPGGTTFTPPAVFPDS